MSVCGLHKRCAEIPLRTVGQDGNNIAPDMGSRLPCRPNVGT